MQSFPPPPPHTPSFSNFPVLIVALIGILATAFLLISYYIFVIKCCLNWHRIDLLRRLTSSRRLSAENPHPAYSPATVARGLDDSLVRLIPVIKFRKEENHEAEYFECSICLNEFSQGEKLRVIPNCCHAFHIDCIDIWLLSNANCPVCRSGISSNTLSSFPKSPNLAPVRDQTQNGNSDRFTGNDDDYVIIEIRDNNFHDPIMIGSGSSGDLSPISIVPSPWKKTEHGKKDLQTSIDDELVDVRSKEDEFERVYPIRRSFSMDLTTRRELCSEIEEVLENSRKQRVVERSMRRSFFSFGSGRVGSRNAVLPLQLD